jgi:transcriptional regulator with XRE-family HTH domain
MNEVIATNIRQYREHLSWTQEQLADAAQVNVRTVQRAEEGLGMSAETLTAIAGAFDVSVDDLRNDPQQFLADLFGVAREEVTPALIASKVDEARARYWNVPLTVVQSSADLRPVLHVLAIAFECGPVDDHIQDAASVLKEMMTDAMDLAGLLGSELDERRTLKAVFEVVGQLRGLGCTVGVGTCDHRLDRQNRLVDPQSDSGDSIPWPTLYVFVALEAETKKVVLVEKGTRASFQA